MSDESQVSKLLFLKRVGPSVGSVVKGISTTCEDAKKQMDGFARDGGINFQVSDLPAVEQRSRELQAKEESRLLLGSSGKDLELRLTFTQVEAMGYAMHLAQALAEREDNVARKAFLENLATRCAALRDQVMGLLSVKS